MKQLTVVLLMGMVALAGCAGGKNDPLDAVGEDVPELDVSDTKGGIRGIVVDEAIRPISGAKIEVVGASLPLTAESDEGGLFALTDLEPGSYLVKASHPLYDAQQATTEVVAGDSNPPPVKILLTRLVFEEPYMEQLQFTGFIVCSTNIPLVAYSEECGEGVGSPRDSCFLVPHPPQCVANPVMPGQRIGGQAGNNPQFDFVLHPGFNVSVIELVWKPTSEAGRAFFVPVSTDWLCDPFCGGHRMVEDSPSNCGCMTGESPLYGRVIAENQWLQPPEFTFDQDFVTVFTWAEMSDTPQGSAGAVLLNQQYQEYVTNFYYLPPPDGWSFVNGDEDPFK